MVGYAPGGWGIGRVDARMVEQSGRLGRWRVASRTPWVRTVAVLWVAQVIAEMAFSFALPFIPLYVQELGVADPTSAGVWAGLMSGAFALVMGLFGPIWGMVADRYGRRLMIQRALFGACIVIGAMAIVRTPEQLFALRLVQGAVTGLVAAISTVVSLTVPKERLASALGFMQTSLFVGNSIGPILGGVVSDAVGFRTAFAMTGVLFLFSGFLVTLFVTEPPRPEVAAKPGAAPGDPDSRSAWRELLGRREILAILGMIILIRFASFAPNPVLPLFIQGLVTDRERLATLAGLVVASTGIASTISALVTGQLADRFGRRTTLLVCLVAAAILSPPHALVDSVWQLLALRVATGLALGGMMPVVQAIFTELTPPHRRGIAFGILATAGSIGLGGGPLTGSLIAARFGVPAVFVAMAPLFALGAWSLLILPRRERRGATTMVSEGS
jgi:DHA1 family multidrug resistance protein-like MFS transporter